MQRWGRLLAQRAEAAIAQKDFAAAQEILDDESWEIADMREGERLLSDLWYQLHTARLAEKEGTEIDESFKARIQQEFPVPKRLDFRMNS